MANGVVFRRIGGHIVPIKATPNLSDKQRKERAKSGAAQTAGGLAIAGATGVGAAKAVRTGHVFRIKSKIIHATATSAKQLSLFEGVEKPASIALATKRAARMRKAGTVLFKARNPILLGGAGVAAGLLGAGFAKLQEAVTGQKNKEGSTARAYGAAATVAGAATYAAYYRALPIKSFGKIISNVKARMHGEPRPHSAEWWKKNGKK